MALSWFHGYFHTSSRRDGAKRMPTRPHHKFFVEILEERALLNAYVVDMSGDAGTGTGLDGDIRYAITQANMNAGSTITFDTADAGSTIFLTHGELAISASTTITGPGATSLTISGASAGSASRVFDITSPSAVVTISGLTITGGNGSTTFSTTAGNEGGNILNAGALTLSNDIVSSGVAQGVAGGSARGGGILNLSNATLTVAATTFSANMALGGAGGMGVAGGLAAGGGIYNEASGTTDLQANNLFANNEAIGGAGGSGADATTPGGSGTSGMAGGSALGGGVFNGGMLSIIGTTFSGNQATGGAGGVGGEGDAGASNAAGGNGGIGGLAHGGGVDNAAGALVVTDSTFASNQVLSGTGGAGGAGADGGANASGTGGDGGSGGDGGGFGDARGGGIYNNGDDLTVTGSSFTSNIATAGSGGAGGSGGDGGEGLTANGSGGNGGNGGGTSDGTSARGGGIANAIGNLMLTGTSFLRNKVTAGAGGNGGAGGVGTVGGTGGEGGRGASVWGGGVAASGATQNVTITNTSFVSNALTSGAGGLGGAGGMGDTGAGTGGNGGQGGEGGSAWGGGFSYQLNTSHADVNTVTITNSPFTTNTATSGAGGLGGNGGAGNIGGNGGLGGNSAETWGGGFSIDDIEGPTSLVMTGSTVSGNAIASGVGGGGGIGGVGTTQGGVGGGGGAGNSAWGGGIDVEAAFNVTITNCSITSNQAKATSGGAGGAGGAAGAGGTGGTGGTGGDGFSAWGGGISIDHEDGGFNGSAGAVTFTNTQVANNQALGASGGAGAAGGVPTSGGTGGNGGTGGRGGSAWGGGINDIVNTIPTPNLILESSSVSNNIATSGAGGAGGAGASAGIGGNGGNGGASRSAWGGGVSADGSSLTLDNSTVSNNQATVRAGGNGGSGGNGSTGVGGSGGSGGVSASAFGGGISNNGLGLLQIDESTVTGNTLTQDKGGNGGNGGIGVTTGGAGGAGGTPARAEGGGIFNHEASVVIVSSTVAGNVLTGGGGGAGGTGGSGGTGAGGVGGAGGSGSSPQGGGLYDGASGTNPLTITNSTFGGTSTNSSLPNQNRNIAAAGAGGTGGSAGASGSAAANGGAGGNGGNSAGGAIFVANTITTSLTDDTITANEALLGARGAGGAGTGAGTTGAAGILGTGTGGGYFGSTGGGSANGLGNTIIVGNTASVDPDVHGTFVSQGHNILGAFSGANGFVGSDLTGVTAAQVKLGALQDNGGGVPTDALLPGSIAIDAGNNLIQPVLPPPANLVLSTAATGGTLAASTTYGYIVTAVNAQGESLGSVEVTITTGTGATNTVTVTWSPVAGATGYNIYGRTVDGELKLTSVSAGTTSFTDTGALTPSGALPTTNTAVILNDERGIGYNRISNGRISSNIIDVGAFEVQAPIASTTTLVSSRTSTGLGQAVTFTATVTEATPGPVPLQGTVTFFDGTTQLGSPVTLVNGVATLTISSLAPGTHVITARFNGFTQGDAPIFAASTSGAVTQSVSSTPVSPPGSPPTNSNLVAVGSGAGGLVNVYNNGQPVFTNFRPYGAGYTGGVAVAVGDVNGDGVMDFATVNTSGGDPIIEVFNGTTGARMLAFDALPGYTQGVSIAMGDVFGTGRADIVIGLLGDPAFGVFDGQTGTLVSATIVFPGVNVGLNVAVGNVLGSATDQIIVTPTGIVPLVSVYSGGGTLLNQFFAFDPAIAGVGLTVGAGDIAGNGQDELVFGAQINGFDFAVVYSNNLTLLTVVPVVASTAPFRVGTGDLTGDGVPELLVTVDGILGEFSGQTFGLVGAFEPFPGLSGIYVS